MSVYDHRRHSLSRERRLSDAWPYYTIHHTTPYTILHHTPYTTPYTILHHTTIHHTTSYIVLNQSVVRHHADVARDCAHGILGV
jgi:hypothetical protein